MYHSGTFVALILLVGAVIGQQVFVPINQAFIPNFSQALSPVSIGNRPLNSGTTFSNYAQSPIVVLQSQFSSNKVRKTSTNNSEQKYDPYTRRVVINRNIPQPGAFPPYEMYPQPFDGVLGLDDYLPVMNRINEQYIEPKNKYRSRRDLNSNDSGSLSVPSVDDLFLHDIDGRIRIVARPRPFRRTMPNQQPEAVTSSPDLSKVFHVFEENEKLNPILADIPQSSSQVLLSDVVATKRIPKRRASSVSTATSQIVADETTTPLVTTTESTLTTKGEDSTKPAKKVTEKPKGIDAEEIAKLMKQSPLAAFASMFLNVG